jgi:hypothetical protein
MPGTATELSRTELNKGRKILYVYWLFNILALQMLNGNLVTLYALKLNASNFIIGLISSFPFFSFLFLLPGRKLTAYLNPIRLLGIFWVIRYLFVLPLLFAPFFIKDGNTHTALMMLVFSILAFNIARGFGQTGFNPIMGAFAGGNDRATFVANLKIITHVITLIVGVSVALILSHISSLTTYTFFIAIGVVAGLIASATIFTLPSRILPIKPPTRSLLYSLKRASRNRDFVRFLVVFFIINLCTGLIPSFTIVYFKKIYALSDSTTLILSVIGSIGAILIAICNSMIMDFMGARPLCFLYTSLTALSITPLIWAPEIGSQLILLVFVCLIFFVFNIGKVGIETSEQTYFLGTIKSEDRTDTGIYYYATVGFAGMTGALLGGFLLDWLTTTLHLSDKNAFRLLFFLIAGCLICSLVLIPGLRKVGKYSIRDVLSIVFTPRDLKAFSLVFRLEKSHELDEQRALIKSLSTSDSSIPFEDLIDRLKSPRFIVRVESLQALRTLPTPESITPALIREIEENPHTTGHVAAEMIGEKHLSAAIPTLIKAMNPNEYFLTGKCMVALAKLGHREALPQIRRLFGQAQNARLLIHGAVALELFKDVESIPLLLSKESESHEKSVQDEIIMAIAEILNLGNWFYPLYQSYKRNQTQGLHDLAERFDGLQEPLQSSCLELIKALDKMPQMWGSHLRQILPMIHSTTLNTDMIQHALQLKLPENRSLGFLFLACLSTLSVEQSVG